MAFFSGIPLDYVILGGIVLVIALDSLRSGIGRACAIAVALPLTMLLYPLLKSGVLTSSATFLFETPLSQALTFGALLIVSYFLARRMGLEFIDGGMGEPIQAIIAGISIAIIFTVIWIQLPALDTLWHFSDQITSLFTEKFRLWWLLASYAALAFARG